MVRRLVRALTIFFLVVAVVLLALWLAEYLPTLKSGGLPWNK